MNSEGRCAHNIHRSEWENHERKTLQNRFFITKVKHTLERRHSNVWSGQYAQTTHTHTHQHESEFWKSQCHWLAYDSLSVSSWYTYKRLVYSALVPDIRQCCCCCRRRTNANCNSSKYETIKPNLMSKYDLAQTEVHREIVRENYQRGTSISLRLRIECHFENENNKFLPIFVRVSSSVRWSLPCCVLHISGFA